MRSARGSEIQRDWSDLYRKAADPYGLHSDPPEPEKITENVTTEPVTVDLLTWSAAQDLMSELGFRRFDELVTYLIRSEGRRRLLTWRESRFYVGALGVDLPAEDRD